MIKYNINKVSNNTNLIVGVDINSDEISINENKSSKYVKINDIESLINFYNLKCLQLYKITNFSNQLFIDLTLNLTKLIVNYCNLDSLDYIQCLENINYLNCSNNSITTIEPLYKLKKLTNLFINNNRLEAFDSNLLESSGKIRCLGISNNKFRKENNINLEKLINLQLLYADNCNFKKCSILFPKESRITFLSLKNNKIKNLSWLNNNIILIDELYINHNKLKSLKGIEKLSNLQILKCKDNLIESLNPIENLKLLTLINCSNNNISDILPLSNCEELTYINMSNNLITRIGKSFNKLKNIYQIDFSYNLINYINAQFNLFFELQKINLSHNLIESLEFITNVINIKKLKLNNNLIKDISYLFDSSIKELNIKNNDISQCHSSTNGKIILNLQNLKISGNHINSYHFLRYYKFKKLITDININDCIPEIIRRIVFKKDLKCTEQPLEPMTELNLIQRYSLYNSDIIDSIVITGNYFKGNKDELINNLIKSKLFCNNTNNVLSGLIKSDYVSQIYNMTFYELFQYIWNMIIYVDNNRIKVLNDSFNIDLNNFDDTELIDFKSINGFERLLNYIKIVQLL